MAWLNTIKNVEDCIAEGLRQSADIEDWLTFERYLVAARCRPSALYTASLCRVLRLQNDELNLDDVVDVLAEIRDPAAIGCLEETLWWQPPWDEFRQLAVKAVWALSAIGTEEALSVLRDAVSCESEEIRVAAAQELG